LIFYLHLPSSPEPLRGKHQKEERKQKTEGRELLQRGKNSYCHRAPSATDPSQQPFRHINSTEHQPFFLSSQNPQQVFPLSSPAPTPDYLFIPAMPCHQHLHEDVAEKEEHC
jgi:hypothetical protein